MKQKKKKRADLAIAIAIGSFASMAVGCRDVSDFASRRGHYEGKVTEGSFVRSGVVEDARMCLTLDTDRLQDAPGTLTTSDGRFRDAPLRPIPQIWHDPLSTIDFGDGRIQNLVYAASPVPQDGGGPEEAQDVFVILSLMQSKRIEARLLRGAPQADAGPPPPGVARPVFAVFHLERDQGQCSF